MKQEDIIKNKKGKIVMLTAYDYQMAKLLDEAGIDLILVGDSLGMVFQGKPDTKGVTMGDMIYHTRAVARGAKTTPIVGDMPINSYKTPKIALQNAKKFLQAGALAVKLEGNQPKIILTLRKAKIPVMGHLGLLPQTAENYRVKGKIQEEAEKILKDAKELENLGVFSIVLECVPENLAKKISRALKIPTIGIGAGKYCDGQVLVINDLLGMQENFKPKHTKRYLDLSSEIKGAVTKFKEEVKTGIFPGPEHSFH
ncbi:3-methyl-2-oxobutanoate hydroxymethyltransferase [Patescibacteria group bacterium]|nr:3-methyl-2-oxobutanoate hydroxymethyltransferase [Patescibacteria group bacterium]MBU4481023.1 3-methyl-2-oxobutanoate hydroxymethyltransferase [Patescibacteria group bacterium]